MMKKSDPQLLAAICSLLIKGNKSGPEYYLWYRRGVEQELRGSPGCMNII